MIQFLDWNGNKVELSFSKDAFEEESKHVLVISKYGKGWLLTNHKKRGLEFPGGKREAGETLEEAAKREAYEETGSIFSTLQYLAAYKVFDEKGPFVKTVFWGQVKELKQTGGYFETNGPVVMEGDLLRKRFGKGYSFIMKDQVVEECLKFIDQQSIKE